MIKKMKMVFLAAAAVMILSMPAMAGTVTPLNSALTDKVVTVTIVKIDLASRTLVVKDSSGEIYEWVVEPNTLDFTKIKVGQVLNGTIEEIVSSVTGKVIRAATFKAGSGLAKAIIKK